ncbi:MAG: HAMP domain-containing histidine kinase [Acidobacteria bacterium]|nr:HAMP domain-containing histidine kinase [Acidobacteriota bacterium]MBI3469855.1 HAMP domain-containing histidine kinase [Candidatus Solibacter usitatus]
MLPAARQSGPGRLSTTDKLFAGLRLIVLLACAAWLLLAPRLAHRAELLGVFFVFVIYTLFIYGLIFLTRWPIDRIYLAASVLDLVYLLGMVRWSGGVNSVFLLGFYLLAGLHSFYFGRRVGLTIATAAAVLLAWGPLNRFQAEPWPDSVLRLGFLYLTAWSIGLLADREKETTRQAEELVAQLQNATRILEHAQKMALIGRLTAGIAHEINNPATVVLTRVERMLLEAEEKAYSNALRKDLETLRKHASRVAEVVQKMLTYSRADSSGFVPLDINEVIEQSIPMVEHRLETRGLTLNLNLLRRLPRIYGSAERLEEVFVNLISNAIDASPPAGQIYIVSTISGGQEKEVQVFVSDAGAGIPPENLDRIFEPFFTTKPPGQGTGLGLYVTYQILKDHRASIAVDSQPGKGATVSLGFPLLRDALSPASPAGKEHLEGSL